MTFQAWKTKIRNSMTFQDFQDPYEPCSTLDPRWGYRPRIVLQIDFLQERNIRNDDVLVGFVVKKRNNKQNVLSRGKKKNTDDIGHMTSYH
jgi:hypothetical protein